MTDTRTQDALAALFQRQEAERRELAEQLLAEERAEANALLAAIAPQVGAALADALDQIEHQIRADRRAGTLLAKVETALPSWADVAFSPLDPDEIADGHRSVIVYVPRVFGDGHRERRAIAMVDVSDAVFGSGSERERERAAAEQVEREDARNRGIVAEADRESRRG